MKTVVVCAAVIIRNGRALIAQRKAGGEQGLLWEFPGGKLIPGETPEECLVREIKEELDMTIRVGDVLKVTSHSYERDTQILLLAYLCEHIGGEGKNLDCNDFHWVEPPGLVDYRLAEADLPVLKKLITTPSLFS